jgi:hypothetical protein
MKVESDEGLSSSQSTKRIRILENAQTALFLQLK